MSSAPFRVTTGAGLPEGGSGTTFTFTVTAAAAASSAVPFTVTISNPAAGVWHQVNGVWKRVQVWHYLSPGGWVRVS